MLYNARNKLLGEGKNSTYVTIVRGEIKRAKVAKNQDDIKRMEESIDVFLNKRGKYGHVKTVGPARACKDRKK